MSVAEQLAGEGGRHSAAAWPSDWEKKMERRSRAFIMPRIPDVVCLRCLVSWYKYPDIHNYKCVVEGRGAKNNKEVVDIVSTFLSHGKMKQTDNFFII